MVLLRNKKPDMSRVDKKSEEQPLEGTSLVKAGLEPTILVVSRD